MATTDPEEWRIRPPYGGPRSEGFQGIYNASCFCKAILFETSTDPVDAKFCHCTQCQRLHGAPMQWAVIFKKENVRFLRGLQNVVFYNSEYNTAEHILPCKVRCRLCGSPIADEGRNMFLAFGNQFLFHGKVPDKFKPSCHIYYDQRVADIKDDLPKYREHKGGELVVSADPDSLQKAQTQ